MIFGLCQKSRNILLSTRADLHVHEVLALIYTLGYLNTDFFKGLKNQKTDNSRENIMPVVSLILLC